MSLSYASAASSSCATALSNLASAGASLAAETTSNPTSLLKYSVSAATLTALSWSAYQEHQKRTVASQTLVNQGPTKQDQIARKAIITWKDLARARRRTAAGAFCACVIRFQSTLRNARECLLSGRIEEAMDMLVSCLESWQFKAQTLKALKKHLHPEFFARLINRLVERKLLDWEQQEVLCHFSAGAPPPVGFKVGFNMDLHSNSL